MIIELEVAYKIEDIVYLVTDHEQDAHIVIGYQITKGQIIYCISFNGKETTVYDFEISASKNQLMQLGIK